MILPKIVFFFGYSNQYLEYHAKTVVFPQRIVYFHDEAAKDQFQNVKEIEVTAVNHAISEISGMRSTVIVIVARKEESQ